VNDSQTSPNPAAHPAAAAVEAAAEPSRRVRVRPLLALVPYVMRYRGKVAAALIALLVASAATLAVPLAVRRMIDFGFTHQGLNLIDSYFAVMIAVAGVLAVASAVRYYLVITLGERIVADLRSDVFNHLTSLSVSYFDQTKTGEILSRLTADTTQIKSAVGSSVSIALRNIVLFVGASTMMVITSPRLSFFVLIAIPVIVLPLYGFGRAIRQRGRAAQDTLADASAYASELVNAIRTVQAYTSERFAEKRFGGEHSKEGRAKLFEVRESERDVSFLRRFLTEDLCRELDIFTWKPRGEHLVVSEVADQEHWNDVKNALLKQIGTGSMPTIKIHDANHKGRRGLYLVHDHDGRDLDMTHADKTLHHLRTLWGRDTYLQTFVRGKKTLMSVTEAGFDAKLVSWVVGTRSDGNAIPFADGSGMLFLEPACSSLTNLSIHPNICPPLPRAIPYKLRRLLTGDRNRRGAHA